MTTLSDTRVEDPACPAHVCAVPVSDAQLWEMTARFLADGLAAGEHVVYFEDGTADAVLERLSDDRVDVSGPLRRGQFAILPTEVTRAMLDGPASGALAALDDTITGALDQGFPGVRMAGETAYGLSRADGVPLLEFESGVDDVIADRPARVLCLYDRARFSEDGIERLRAVHRTEIAAPAVYDDSLLRITRPAPSVARLAGEVDHSNRPRVRRVLHAVLDEVLRSSSSSPEVTLDLSSLRFLDVAGAVGLVHAAEEFPSTHRLVLTGVRPGVLRLLDRCGAPFSSHLRVEPRTAAAPPTPAS